MMVDAPPSPGTEVTELTDVPIDGASFPSPEEIRAGQIPYQKSRTKYLYIGAAVGCILILFMVIYFPLTNDDKSERTRMEQVLMYVSTRVDRAAMADTNSYQYKAATWMAIYDPRELAVTDDAAFFQRYALVCFYYATTPWRTSLSFLTGKHECDWNSPLLLNDGSFITMGVQCNSRMAVESITIHVLGMSGTLPGEIGLLTSLTELALDYNQLTGLSETNMASLTLLNTLTLTNNQVKGPIPSWIGELTALSYLLLSSNDFQGTIPFQLQKLTKMTTLGLDDNLLVGTLDALDTMSILRQLKADGNNITQLPNALAALTKLEYFNVGYNQMAEPLPTWLGFLTALEVLVFSNNEFSGKIPTELQKLSKLTSLALDDNKLEGGFDVIEKMTWLEQLYLEDNLLTGTITNNFLINLSSLRVLDLSNNLLDGIVARSLLRKKNLTILDLSSNNLIGNIPSDLPETFGLQFLSLQNNIIEGPLPDTISNFGNLTHLDFSTNRMTGTLPTTLGLLTKLEYLFLAKNPSLVPGPVPDWVASLIMLEELSLKGTNRNGTIPTFLGKLTNLVLLDLDQNGFTGKLPNDLGKLTNLLFLLVGRNKLTGSLPTTLRQLPALKMLLMDENSMTGSAAAVCGGTNKPAILIVDCEEIICDCCTKCCADTDDDCNDSDLLANYDPIWENSYQRNYYTFDETITFVPSSP